MSNWNRNAVREFLETLDGATITETQPGGDYDLPGLQVQLLGSDNFITISPYRDPSSKTIDYSLDDNCEVYAIELRTDGDSRGGLQSNEENVCVAFGKIRAKLGSDGHSIIGHYDEIF